VLILLTHANHLFSDRKQVQKMQPYPPLQTLIAANVLRREGHEVAFFDTTFDREYRNTLQRVRPDLVAVCEDNFNFLTKMCLLQNRNLAFEIAREAVALGIPALVNSSDASDHPGEYLEAGFDQVILGELEATLVEAVGRTAAAGTAYFSEGSVKRGPVRAAIRDLDALPSPAWDLVDIEPYREAWKSAHGYFSLNLVASRGCPYQCNWCAKPLYGSAYRCHSAERFAMEVESARDLFAPDHFWFADDIFGLSSRWTNEFVARTQHAPVPFRMQSRCDLMTRDAAAALAEAGCTEVWMGVESGSQRILDAMDKGTRVEEVREARENLRMHGIRAGYFLQLGYSGEEWEDIEATIRLVRETRPDDIGVSVSYPLPNTRFHQIVSAQIGAQANWKDSGDLAAVFQSAFPSELYRALADALHREVRGEHALEAWDKVEQLRCACC
jgi:anaerobic magnesium-protoporphyrin IX monomethyl ester cyclase